MSTATTAASDVDAAPKRRVIDAESLILTAFIAIAMMLWLLPLRSSLWLDELGTYWIIQDGFGDALQRSLTFQGQSPLYFLVERGVVGLFGASEIVMRLPSLVFMALAAFLLFRLASELLDRRAGLLTALAFVTGQAAMFAAGDARPYALALLLSIGSTLAFVRWAKEPSVFREVLYALLVAAVIYAHFLFALMLVAHVGYAVAARRTSRISIPGLVRAWAVAGVLCGPLFGQIFALWRRGESLSWPGDALFADLLLVVGIPMVVTAAGLILEVIAPDQERPKIGPGLALLLGWAFAPVIVTFVVSSVTAVKVFHPKYYMSALPGAAFLIGWALREVRLPPFRVVAAVGLLLLSFSNAGTAHDDENWRGAVRDANALSTSRTPVLVNTGFIEARQISWVTDPARREFLLAPFSYYELTGKPVLLPYGADDDLVRFAVDAAEREAGSSDRLLLITNYRNPFQMAIAHRLASRGYFTRDVAYHGTILVAEFSRVPVRSG